MSRFPSFPSFPTAHHLPALLVLGGLAVALVAPAVLAHPLAPALLGIRQLDQDSRFEVLWRETPGQLRGVRLEPRMPAHCTDEGEREKSREGVDIVTRWVVDCGETGLAGSAVAVDGVEGTPVNVLVFARFADGRHARGVLSESRPQWEVPLSQTGWQVAVSYFDLGLEHILGGFDHLLFVLGLVLLVAPWKKLLWTVTGFTLGHSITLALATLDLVSLPSRFVEAAIAFSIYWLAVEVVREGPSLLKRFPAVMATAFGLLHGLGFAGALAEVGLPAGEIPLALASFNVGIEAGQVAFVIVALGLGALIHRLPWQPAPWVRALPVYLIGTLGAYWFLERVLGLG